MNRSVMVRGCLTALFAALLALPAMAQDFKFAGYPMKTDQTLKVWMPSNVNWASAFRNFGDMPFAKELEKQTGVKVQYVHPAVGQEQQALALVIASGELPDVYMWGFGGFPGGPEKAVKDGAILRLNELIAKENPNLNKLLDSVSHVKKLLKTDTGLQYAYPFVRDYVTNPDLTNATTGGPIVRQDWLNDLGLKQPETIDEWAVMLKAFKDKKGAVAPLTLNAAGTGLRDNYLNYGFLIGAYVPTVGLYQDDGVVKYGAAQPGFKDFIAQMAKWYKEGLIDGNVFTTDQKLMESNMLTGKSGATFGFASGTLGKLVTLATDKDPKYDLAGLKYPVLKKGTKPAYAQYTAQAQTVASLGAKTKVPALVARWMDFAYSDAGHKLYVFGVEGQSYSLVDGKPKLTDLIMNNPEGLTLSQAIARYSVAYMPWPYQNDPAYIAQQYVLPQMKPAIKNFGTHDAAKHVMFGLSATPDEASGTAKITTSLNAYLDEMTAKFIFGVEPLEKFAQFQAELVKLGVNDLVAMTQDQLERANKR